MSRQGLWRDPDFLKLWSGQTISQIGSRITRDGLPYAAVLTLGASPLQMGILSGAGAAVALVFGLFAGAWADRLRRRPILIAADLGRAVVLGTIPLAALLHRLTMNHLYVAAALSTLLTVVFDVSYQTYLPSLVDRKNILEGNSKLALTESIAEVAGPGLAGLLVQWITAPIAILLDAVSFVCSAVSVWMIRKPEPSPERRPQPHIGREIVEGLRLSWSNPILRALILRAATASFFLGFGSMYVLLAIRELGLNAALLGVVIAVGGAGSLLGSLAAERLVRRFGFNRIFLASAVLPVFGMMLPPLAYGPVWSCAGVLMIAQIFDIAWPVYNITHTTIQQTIAPAEILGRVNSAMHLTYHVVMPLGALAGGALAEVAGVRVAMLIGSVGFLLSTLWLFFSPVRHFRP
jgi:predicted MFS family arabinose efflux permease